MLIQQSDKLVAYPFSSGPDDEVVVGRPFHSEEFVRQIEEAINTDKSVQQIADTYSTTPYVVNLIRRRVYVARLMADPLLQSLDENKALVVKYKITQKLFRKYHKLLAEAFQDEFPENYHPVHAVRSILNMSCVNTKTAPFYTLLGLLIDNVPEKYLHEFECLFVSAHTRKIAYAYMRRYMSPSVHCYLLRCARRRVGYRKFSLPARRSRMRFKVEFTEYAHVFGAGSKGEL